MERTVRGNGVLMALAAAAGLVVTAMGCGVGYEPDGADVDEMTGEAAADESKGDSALTPTMSCGRGYKFVNFDYGFWDAAGTRKATRVSACVATNAQGEPIVNGSNVASTATGIIVKDTSGGDWTCRDYGSITCCWNKERGFCFTPRDDASGRAGSQPTLAGTCPSGSEPFGYRYYVNEYGSPSGAKTAKSLSACLAKDSRGRPRISGAASTATRTALQSLQQGGAGGASLTCKRYGTIFCCWTPNYGACVNWLE